MSAHVVRIAAKSGNRDNDYWQAQCKCGWSSAHYANRTVEGHTLAERRAAGHKCHPLALPRWGDCCGHDISACHCGDTCCMEVSR